MKYFIRFLQVVFYGVICACVFFAGYYFDIAPLEVKLATAQQKQFELKNQIRWLGYRQISLEEKIARLPEVEDLLASSQTRFIKARDLDKLYKEFVQLGKAKQLQFGFFNAGDLQFGKYYQRLPVSLIVTGNYSALTEFIREIAGLPWLVGVEDFAVVSVDRRKFSGDLMLAIYQVR